MGKGDLLQVIHAWAKKILNVIFDKKIYIKFFLIILNTEHNVL